MQTEAKSQAKIQDVCDARKVIAGLDAGVSSLIVGFVIGHAIDFIQRAIPGSDDPAIGLAGRFELIPALSDEAKGGKTFITSSGNLFLPPTFFEPLDKALRAVLYPEAAKPDKKVRGGSIQFAAEIHLARAENREGFVWALNFLKNPDAVDPLEALRLLALKKPSDAPAAAPATETTTAASQDDGKDKGEGHKSQVETGPGNKGKRR